MSASNSKHGSFIYNKRKKIHAQKGEHSCKCTELSLKWKEGIVLTCNQNGVVKLYT